MELKSTPDLMRGYHSRIAAIGKTWKDLAQASGVSQVTISEAKTGKRDLKLKTAMKLNQAVQKLEAAFNE